MSPATEYFDNPADVLVELYCAHQLMRTLGFPSDSLHVSLGEAPAGPYKGRVCVALHLEWQGKTFVYTIAPVAELKTFTLAWAKFIEDANAGVIEDAALAVLYKNSASFQGRDLVITAMRAKGVIPPCNLD